jgi:hypothetical protein
VILITGQSTGDRGPTGRPGVAKWALLAARRRGAAAGRGLAAAATASLPYASLHHARRPTPAAPQHAKPCQRRTSRREWSEIAAGWSDIAAAEIN